jgi:hypothetical protein
MAFAIRQTEVDEKGIDQFGPVSEYYSIFPREPSPLGPWRIDQVVVIRDISFEKLIDMMLGLRQKEYLVVCHGSPFGFFMPLITGTESSAMALNPAGGDGALKILMKIIDELANADAAAQKVKEDERVAAWKALIQRLVGKKEADQITSSKEGKAAFTKWLDEFSIKSMNIKGKAIERLARKVKQLRQKHLDRVELRACDIGARPDALDILRQTLGAKAVAAPNMETFYVVVRPSFGPHKFEEFNKSLKSLGKNRYQVFGFKPPQPKPASAGRRGRAPVPQPEQPPMWIFILGVFKESAVVFRGDASANRFEAIQRFVGTFMMSGSRYNPRARLDLPVTGFWTDDSKRKIAFALPPDSEYKESIVTKSE